MTTPAPGIAKAHAYDNDFLFVLEDEVPGRDLPALARATCDRHAGLGADGLIVYRRTESGAAMRLFNADGSAAEVSGNGVRCLGALVARARGLREPVIATGAGDKRLTLLGVDGPRWTFRAAMGHPDRLRRLELEAAGERLAAVALTVGNPHCVVLAPIDEARYRRLGPALATHPEFPEGTNVELADVESPGRVRILIWERGVGPTLSSGTGSCAAAVAAAVYGGAGRDLEVVAPGGSQRVEWTADGLFLTGWAALVFEGTWLA